MTAINNSEFVGDVFVDLKKAFDLVNHNILKKNLYLLSQLKHFVDTSKQKLLYYAHISPHLTYASTVWDGCSDILFHKLNSLHRRAAKLMMPDLSLTTDAKLQHLGLLPLREKLMLK